MPETKGSIIIDADLDSKSFETGTKEMERAIKSLHTKVEGMGLTFRKAMDGNTSAMKQFDQKAALLRETISSIETKMEQLGAVKVENKEFASLRLTLIEAEERIRKLTEAQQKLESSGKDYNYSIEYKVAMAQADEYRAKLTKLLDTHIGLLRSGKQNTEAFKTVEKEIDAARAGVSKYTEKMAQLRSEGKMGKLSDEWVKNNDELTALKNKIVEVKTQMAYMVENGKTILSGSETAEFQELASTLESIKGKLSQMQQGVTGAKQALAEEKEEAEKSEKTHTFLSNAIEKVGKVGKKAFSALWAGAKKIFNVKNAANGVEKSLGKLTKSFTSFIGRIKTRLWRQAISYVFNGFKEGFENIKGYLPEVEQNFNQLQASMLTLKNSFGAAFAPILTAVAPALITLINLCVSAVEWVGKLIAALTGATSFTRAVKVQEDYAKALGGSAGAAKDLKRQLAGFDELNILTDNQSGGGGGGGVGDVTGMFEEVPIESAITGWAKRVVDAFKAQDYEEVGRAIGEGITTAVKKADDFINNIDFTGFGVKIANGLNGLFESLDLSEAGKLLADAANGIFDTFGGFVETFEWNKFASNIAGGISGAISNFDWSGNAKAVSKFLVGLTGSIATTLKEIDWVALGQGIADALAAIDWKQLLTNVWEIIVGVFKGLVTTLQTIFATLTMDGVSLEIKNAAEEIVGNVETMQAAFENSIAGYDLQKEHAFDLVSELEELQKGFENGAVSQEELKNKVDEICQLYPDLIQYVNDEGTGFTITNDAIREQIELLTEKAKASAAEEALTEAYKEQYKAQSNLTKATVDYQKKQNIDEIFKTAKASGLEWRDVLEENRVTLEEAGYDVDKLKSSLQKLNMAQVDNKTKTNQSRAALDSATYAVQTSQDYINDLTSTIKTSADSMKTSTGSIKTSIEQNIENPLGYASDEFDALGNRLQHPIGSVKVTSDPSLTETKKIYDGITDKSATVTTKGKTDSTFTTSKSAWDQLRDTNATKTLKGKTDSSFTAKSSEYRGVTDSSATKTIHAVKGSEFDSVVEDYDAIRSKSVTVTAEVKIDSSHLTPSEAKAIDLFETGGIVSRFGQIKRFASGGSIMASGKSSWWDSVQKYATGTSRAHGTVFVAGEAGAEIVGNVNGKTEILNKSQLASAIYAAVVSGIATAFSHPIPVRLTSIGVPSVSAPLASLGTPAMASGSVLPYEVSRRVLEALNGVTEAIDNQTIDLVSAMNQNRVALAQAIIAALDGIGVGGASTTNVTRDINRQTRMLGQSVLLGG